MALGGTGASKTSFKISVKILSKDTAEAIKKICTEMNKRAEAKRKKMTDIVPYRYDSRF